MDQKAIYVIHSQFGRRNAFINTQIYYIDSIKLYTHAYIHVCRIDRRIYSHKIRQYALCDIYIIAAEGTVASAVYDRI